MLILVMATGCSKTAEGPQEEWNDLFIFSYDAEDNVHYGCTLIEDGEEYTASFEDFMNCRIFNDKSDVKWTEIGGDMWVLVVKDGVNKHEFELERTVTAKGNECVAVISWTLNGDIANDTVKTVNFHRLLGSKEWQTYQKE